MRLNINQSTHLLVTFNVKLHIKSISYNDIVYGINPLMGTLKLHSNSDWYTDR